MYRNQIKKKKNDEEVVTGTRMGAGEREVPTLGVERQGRSSQEKRRRKRKRGVRDKEVVSPNLKNSVQISKSFL